MEPYCEWQSSELYGRNGTTAVKGTNVERVEL